MTNDVTAALMNLRQHRRFQSQPVSRETIDNLLEVARWTGSSRNSQPWHFIAITDRACIEKLSELRPLNGWFADAPLVIALVFDGGNELVEAYDEGRVTERLLIAGQLMSLGGGTAWFGEPENQEKAKEILDVAPGKSLRSVVALGYPADAPGPDLPIPEKGRRPLAQVASYR